ncbi:MAG: hypothetical protein KTR24_04095 [Saprospiraceae bacterium]|nr:hypothetical protein [Saprospiraceae bacterium]
MDKNLIWKLCCIAVALMAVLTFTPVVTPVGRSGPALGGVPYTMWMGFLWTLIILVITFIGTKVHPGFEEPTNE